MHQLTLKEHQNQLRMLKLVQNSLSGETFDKSLVQGILSNITAQSPITTNTSIEGEPIERVEPTAADQRTAQSQITTNTSIEGEPIESVELMINKHYGLWLKDVVVPLGFRIAENTSDCPPTVFPSVFSSSICDFKLFNDELGTPGIISTKDLGEHENVCEDETDIAGCVECKEDYTKKTMNDHDIKSLLNCFMLQDKLDMNMLEEGTRISRKLPYLDILLITKQIKQHLLTSYTCPSQHSVQQKYAMFV